MSYTGEVKDELSRVELSCNGCVHAELAALVRIMGSLGISEGKPRLELTTETSMVARAIINLLHSESIDLKTELTIRRSVLHKSHNFLIMVPYQAGLTRALKDLGILGDDGFESGIRYGLVAKDCCAASYLRGAFLAGGYVADPRGDFHFELSTTNFAMAQGLVKIMGRFGINARCVQRHNTHVVYLKGAEDILRFLAFTGANQCALKLEEHRLLKSVRNDTNRRVNAEIANARKTTRAAEEQVAAIRRLIERRGIEAIPTSLQEVCVLRLQHPEASIKELGEYADPPLSKSAVYHRIRRINQMLEE